jgi:uncharacterized lipoprotein YddW (UPF0748 family)
MRIDDGGFVNGVYAIYPAAVPADGRYTLAVTMHVVESSATTTDGIDTYQVGVAIGASAAHRGPGTSAVAPLPIHARYAGLTDADDSALPTQTLVTPEFDAVAGDDLLVGFGTDVTSGAWNAGSGFWNGGYVLVGAIRLVPVAVVDPLNTIDDDDGAPGFTQAGAWTVSSGIGWDGGHYRFASSGAASTARWSATLEPGFYDVEVFYRAGTNRARAAHYTVTGATAFTATIDQATRDLEWVRIGLVEAAGDVSVELSAEASLPAGTVVIADAVRFVPSAGPPPIDPPEMRLAAITVFDPIDDVWAIRSLVDSLADLHYNAIAVHARFRGDATYIPNRTDATYPNSEPRSPAAGEVDVLAEFVEHGHRRGLKVFAYVNTHLVTEGDDVVEASSHVVNTHPEWRTYAYNGGAPVVQTTAHDPEGLWLEPALPAVQRYLSDIVGDIASNYAIDGVILDRIRYPQTAFTRANRDFGYHPDALRTFNFLYGKTGIPDPADPDWIEFRQRAITETVGAIYQRLHEVDPEMQLLAYPIGRFDDALRFNYQDWPRWLAENRIDGVLPQIYTTSTSDFEARVAQHRAAYEGERLLGATLNAFTAGVDLEAQIDLARTGGLDGTSPFRHGVMSGLGYLEPLRRGWDGIAEWPSTPWKTTPLTRLEIAPDCVRDGRTRFRIENANEIPVDVDWWSTSGSGEHIATSGTSFLDAGTRPVEAALITWRDEIGRLQAAASISFPWCR